MARESHLRNILDHSRVNNLLDVGFNVFLHKCAERGCLRGNGLVGKWIRKECDDARSCKPGSDLNGFNLCLSRCATISGLIVATLRSAYEDKRRISDEPRGRLVYFANGTDPALYSNVCWGDGLVESLH